VTNEGARPELCVGAVVVDSRDRILLIRRGTPPGLGRWSIPGGRVQRGEMMVEAVLRELVEETGLEGVCGPLLGWVERIDADVHFVIADFRVELLDEDAPPMAGDDAADVCWMEASAVGERRDLVDGLAEFLADHGIIATIV
jgi:8-oxo-dGTP diphosphatase